MTVAAAAAVAAVAAAGRPGMKMSCEERGALKERLTCRMTKQQREMYLHTPIRVRGEQPEQVASSLQGLDCERKGECPQRTYQLHNNYQFIYF